MAARHLARAGVAVRVALTAPPAKVGGDAAVMLAALERMGGVPIADGSGWTGEAAWREWLAGAGVVVDAIFGTGFHGAITGVPAAALAAMNAARARKLAVDVPSGLDADTGRAARPGVPRRRDRDDGRRQARAVRRRGRAGRAGRGRRARRSDPDRRRRGARAATCWTKPVSRPGCRGGGHRRTRGAPATCWWSPARRGRRGRRCWSDRRRCARAPVW